MIILCLLILFNRFVLYIERHIVYPYHIVNRVVELKKKIVVTGHLWREEISF